jgi:adrenodoxin-NADP+ reductase
MFVLQRVHFHQNVQRAQSCCYNVRIWSKYCSILRHNFSLTIAARASSPFYFRVAIVGSGPSGCYTAKYLQSMKPSHVTCRIDIFERLPTPYGLVRFGVAPDHPEVKNVMNDFDQLFHSPPSSTSKASGSECHFWGNVTVGKDISIHELRERYHAVVLAYGCESDHSLDIPGADTIKTGIIPAREFVAWYNGT